MRLKEINEKNSRTNCDLFAHPRYSESDNLYAMICTVITVPPYNDKTL